MTSTTQTSPTEVLRYIEGPPLDGKSRNGWERFVSFVETQPDRMAVVSIYQPPALYPSISTSTPATTNAASSYLRWTYHDLKVAIDRLALQLRSRGVQPGTTIVTFLPNGVESVVARLTASILSCVLAPLNPKHLVNKDEITHLLRLFLLRPGVEEPAKAAVIIVADKHTAARVDHEQTEFTDKCVVKLMCPQLEVGREVSEVDSNLLTAGWCYFQDLMQEEPEIPEPFNSSSPSNAASPTDELILCTSGTTSLPKACFWTTSQISYHYHVLEQSRLHGLSPEDKALVCLSNNHIAGYDALSAALFFGGTAVIPGSAFDVDDFVRAAVQENITYTILVPTSKSILSSFQRQPYVI